MLLVVWQVNTARLRDDFISMNSFPMHDIVYFIINWDASAMRILPGFILLALLVVSAAFARHDMPNDAGLGIQLARNSVSTPEMTIQSQLQGNKKDPKVYVDLFLTTSCPHCRQADEFFTEIEKQLPWLQVDRFYIDKDKASLVTFGERLRQEGSQNFSVPAFLFCGSHWVGFSEYVDSGKRLLDALHYCHQQIIKEGLLTSGTINVLRQWSMASQFNLDPAITKSPVKFITLAAFTDAFTPCSLFIFAAFIAFLWLYTASKREQLISGTAFILFLGFIHYLNLAFFKRYYYLVPELRYAAAIVGVLILFFIGYYYRKTVLRGVPARVLPGLFFIPLTIFAVYAYQQNCLMNVGLMFQQWLIRQNISDAAVAISQFYYQLLYVLPYIILLIFYVFLSHKPRIVLYHKALNIAGALILAMIATLLMVYPHLLANFLVSCTMLIFALLIGWLIARVYGGR